MTTTLVRTGSALAAAGLLVGMLSACTPEADPTPTPTKTAAFATDEEAYAAAEETYRAYSDATNASDLTDPDSFEPVFALLAGPALSTERETFSQMRASDLTRTGSVSFDSFTPVSVDGSKVTANVCLDVSAVELTYPDGTSAVPADRPPRTPRTVVFSPGASPTGLKIVSSVLPDGEFRC